MGLFSGRLSAALCGDLSGSNRDLLLVPRLHPSWGPAGARGLHWVSVL